jgi:hypothetical protein
MGFMGAHPARSAGQDRAEERISVLAEYIPPWFGAVPILENLRNYLINGSFDVYDLMAIGRGSLTAFEIGELLSTRGEENGKAYPEQENFEHKNWGQVLISPINQNGWPLSTGLWHYHSDITFLPFLATFTLLKPKALQSPSTLITPLPFIHWVGESPFS